VDGLCMFYLRRARFMEGFLICQKAYVAITNETPVGASPVASPKLRARLLTWQAVFTINLEDLHNAGQFLCEGQSILEHTDVDPQQVYAEVIFLLVIQALLANRQYDPCATLGFYQQALALSQKVTGKVPRWLVFYWRFLMRGAVSTEIYLQMEQDLDAVRKAGDPFELGCHLFVLGIAEVFHTFDVKKAEPLLKESCEILQALDDPASQVMIFKTLGYLLSIQGQFEENLVLKQRELAICQELGDRSMIGIAHAEVGETLCHLGKYTEAEDQIRMGLALVKGRSDYEYALRHRYLGDILLAQGKYQQALEAYQFSIGFFKSVNEKGWMLTALTGLSRTEFALGNRSDAWTHANQALQLYREVKLYTFFVFQTLAEIALLLVDQGEIARALELYTLVVQQAYLAKSRWFADLYGRTIEQAVASLSQDEQTAARARAQTLNIFDFTFSP
jgi:tetratricopeptide (TPR) repeat protein